MYRQLLPGEHVCWGGESAGLCFKTLGSLDVLRCNLYCPNSKLQHINVTFNFVISYIQVYRPATKTTPCAPWIYPPSCRSLIIKKPFVFNRAELTLQQMCRDLHKPFRDISDCGNALIKVALLSVKTLLRLGSLLSWTSRKKYI